MIGVLVTAGAFGFGISEYASGLSSKADASQLRNNHDSLERRVGDVEKDLAWLKTGVWALLQKSGITDIEPPP